MCLNDSSRNPVGYRAYPKTYLTRYPWPQLYILDLSKQISRLTSKRRKGSPKNTGYAMLNRQYDKTNPLLPFHHSRH